MGHKPESSEKAICRSHGDHATMDHAALQSNFDGLHASDNANNCMPGVGYGHDLPHVRGIPILATHGYETMKFLHTMVRVADLDQSLDFYCNKLGLKEVRRSEYPAGRFTLVYLAAEETPEAEVELTYNWDPETYTGGRNFGHLAFEVADIYATCQSLMDKGVTINRPPRDGRMAFVRSPDNISIELLQKGGALPPAEPWTSMANIGAW